MEQFLNRIHNEINKTINTHINTIFTRSEKWNTHGHLRPIIHTYRKMLKPNSQRNQQNYFRIVNYEYGLEFATNGYYTHVQQTHRNTVLNIHPILNGATPLTYANHIIIWIFFLSSIHSLICSPICNHQSETT